MSRGDVEFQLYIPEPTTVEEEHAAALNILDHLDAEINPRLNLYAFLTILAALGIPPHEFNPDEMFDAGLLMYMEIQ